MAWALGTSGVEYSEDYASTVGENIPRRNVALFLPKKLKTRHKKLKYKNYRITKNSVSQNKAQEYA